MFSQCCWQWFSLQAPCLTVPVLIRTATQICPIRKRISSSVKRLMPSPLIPVIIRNRRISPIARCQREKMRTRQIRKAHLLLALLPMQTKCLRMKAKTLRNCPFMHRRKKAQTALLPKQRKRHKLAPITMQVILMLQVIADGSTMVFLLNGLRLRSPEPIPLQETAANMRVVA